MTQLPLFFADPRETYSPEDERQFRKDVRDAIQSLHHAKGEPPAVRLVLSTDFTVPTATTTGIEWDAADFDTDELFSASTNPDRITIRESGIYLFEAAVVWDDLTGSATNRLDIYKNGLSDPLGRAANPTGDADIALALTIIDRCARGDFFTAEVWQASGGNVDVLASSGRSHFSAVRIG